MFQQDNASIHTTSQINEYFEESEIRVISWPVKSPDLNLIEEVRSALKSKLKRSYKCQEDLEEDVTNVWENIPSTYIANLYHSMKARLQTVIDVKGGPTDY